MVRTDIEEFVEWFEMSHPRIFNEVHGAFKRYMFHQMEDMTLSEDDKGNFFDESTLSEIIQNLIDLGLPTTGDRKEMSVRLYNAVYENFWSED